MREGTKKLFPNDYDKFIAAMNRSREEDELPVLLRLYDIKDFTLKDFQDTFSDFTTDTGLELTGMLTLDRKRDKLCIEMKVDYPEIGKDEGIPLQ